MDLEKMGSENKKAGLKAVRGVTKGKTMGRRVKGSVSVKKVPK